MEQNFDSTTKTYDGLLRLGYVANLRGAAYLKELQEVLNGTEEEPSSQSIRERVNAAEIIFINRFGYPQDAAGRKITEKRAMYKAFNTGYKNVNGEAVYGWFEKDQDTGRFNGVAWAISTSKTSMRARPS